MPLNFWDRISTQLYIGFGSAVVLIAIISLLALTSLNYVSKLKHTVSKKNIPEMTAAFSVAQQTAVIVAAVPLLTESAPGQFETEAAALEEHTDRFEAQISVMMETQGRNEQAQKVQSDGEAMIRNVERIKLLAGGRLGLRRKSMSLRDELRNIRGGITPAITREIDAQTSYITTGRRSAGEAKSPRSARFSEPEFLTYSHLLELREASAVAAQLLADAFAATDAAALEPLRKQFEDEAGIIGRSLGALENSPLHGRLSGIFEELVSFGGREGNVFDLRGRELALNSEISSLLGENQTLALDIAARAESVVNDSKLATGKMTGKAAAVTATSAKLLLIVNIASIAGAVLFGWLVVQRRLVRRLGRISNQMRQIADGNLEIAINTKGNDEIAQLAKGLRVFRNNALEAQRLNLVETLANELQEKNEELAHTNEELKRVQDQIVMREKLAALGQLTAGVAHEIRNPMNFIMNFSDVSRELLEELLEEVAKNKSGGETEEEYDAELVEELVEDLTGNLKRIHEHGKRADRIVTDMLKMGRGGGEWQSVDLKVLLNEHVWLAFHSARAADNEFQLEIKEDYSPDIGEITVQPQDIGRVFLNLVTNACYATNEKRKMPEAGNYQPTLEVSTRLADDRIEVHVRDNGTGIPESALERIFNPFYTTKPTDEGTGLGLSMSNDIIRQHGGEFRVETEEGEYTNMIVVLPLDPAAHQTVDASEEEPAEGGATETASS